METNETWTYTCRKYLEYTTLNTATATGSGNGLTVTDVSVANVTLSEALIPIVPLLPNTGINPLNRQIAWVTALAAIFAGSVFLFAFAKRKRLF